MSQYSSQITQTVNFTHCKRTTEYQGEPGALGFHVVQVITTQIDTVIVPDEDVNSLHAAYMDITEICENPTRIIKPRSDGMESESIISVVHNFTKRPRDIDFSPRKHSKINKIKLETLPSKLVHHIMSWMNTRDLTTFSSLTLHFDVCFLTSPVGCQFKDIAYDQGKGPLYTQLTNHHLDLFIAHYGDKEMDLIQYIFFLQDDKKYGKLTNWLAKRHLNL